MSRKFIAGLWFSLAVLRAATLGQGYVRDVAISPNGEQVAVARTTQVEIWDSGIRHLIATIPHTGRLAWSPDATKLAIQGSGTTLWDVQGPSKLAEWPADRSTESLNWSPSGDRIVEATVFGAQIYGKDGKFKISLPQRRLFEVAWSAIGDYVGLLVDGGVEIWDPESGKKIRTIALTGGINEVFQKRWASLAWSSREPFLATCSRANIVQIWNAQTGDLIATMQGGGTMHSKLAWSRDGEQVALATDQSLIVWEARSGKRLHQIQPTLRIMVSSFSPMLDHAIAANAAGEFELWNIASGEKERIASQNAEDEYIAWSPRDTTLTSWGSSGVVQIWDHSKGVLRSQFHAAIWGDRSVVWSADGAWLAAAADDGSISLHDAVAGDVTVTLQGARPPVYAISQAPDKKRLAAVAGGSLWIWDLVQPRPPTRFPIAGRELAWSSDGAILVGTMDDSLIEVDLATGKQVSIASGKQGNPLWLSADGKAFVGGGGLPSTLWLRDDLGEMREVGSIEGFRGNDLSYTSGGGYLNWIVQGYFPGEFLTYDLQSGKTSRLDLPGLPGHKYVAVSTDRRALAVGVGGVILIKPGPGSR